MRRFLQLRRRLAKNAFTVLMLSRGTPMFLAGDEFLNTQFGNNNAYCQDNEISWLDWARLEENQDHFAYVKHMIHFRKSHDVIRRAAGSCTTGLPQMQIREPDDHTKVFGVIYAGRTPDGSRDDVVCLALNVYWEEQPFTLPGLPTTMNWYVEADTSEQYLAHSIPGPEGPALIRERTIKIGPRSAVVLVARGR